MSNTYKINCLEYSECPKEIKSAQPQKIDSNNFLFLFVGCWGVYCKAGESEISKFKKGKWRQEKVTYGEGYVVQAMTEFTTKNKNTYSIILAGDNVYSTGEKDSQIEENPKLSYDMDLQISRGFENCMKNIPNIKDFLIGVGNHDIETCDVLNKQLNYQGWKMPGLSYTYKYQMKDFEINYIFIDTNMYENKWCKPNSTYPPNAIQEQYEWFGQVLDPRPNVWNIVVGHIPFLCNPHKMIEDDEGNKYIGIREVPQLQRLMTDYNSQIDLYMCADEHQQQYLTLPNLPPQVIAGSGGAILDPVLMNETLKPYTHVLRSTFGFVSNVVTRDKIAITFHSVIPEQYPDKTVIVSSNKN